MYLDSLAEYEHFTYDCAHKIRAFIASQSTSPAKSVKILRNPRGKWEVDALFDEFHVALIDSIQRKSGYPDGLWVMVMKHHPDGILLRIWLVSEPEGFYVSP